MPTQLRPLTYQFAKQHGVLVEPEGDGLRVQHRDPINPMILLELQRYFKKPLTLTPVSDEDFQKNLSQAYESSTHDAMTAVTDLTGDLDLSDLMHALPSQEDLLETQDDAPIIRLINALLAQAIKQKASDIHFEIFEKHLAVRFRIDGMLREIVQPPRVLAPLLTSRLKIMAKLDIAEKRLPQDGRIALTIANRTIDVRVSTIPTHYGERVVLRLLDQNSAPLNLTRLGMSTDTQTLMQSLIHQPHGIILVTGPTGSGKTTTLYAAMTALNDVERNILTVEDPVEYYLPGIGQTQVNPKVDMTFARGLRAILRQDPDVVMVGEIRDLETAQMATQASLTGHLVLSTLHTNTALGAITRLRDMGVEPFLIASTLIGVAAQRLVRTLCPHCRKAVSATPEECALMKETVPITLYQPVGCDQCDQQGYRGRTALYELVHIDDTLQSMIHRNESESAMEAYARPLFPSMRQDGWRRVRSGETTLSEVLRVTQEDH